MFINIVLLICVISGCYAQLNANRQFRRLQTRPGLPLKTKLQNRRTEKVCYDTVGCFEIPHKRSPLTRTPENPLEIDTKFYLFKRNVKFSHPEMLLYEDKGASLNETHFDPNEAVKIIIHGYMGRWSDDGALESVQAYLKFCKCNVILIDWEKGARGPHYANAAANTELVGRQLGILLLHMIDHGVQAKDIHLVGFSLGAHVAGCASELLKKRGLLIGRITGLDAASPLFRHSLQRDRSKKLDKGDASLVDVIHTDASPIFLDGFGLLEPIGHVDFFPNGGFEQPGCIDSAASVLISRFEGGLTRENACSHIRAWQIFLETLKQKASQTEGCEFIAFKCGGGVESFQKGHCFPYINKNESSIALNHNYRKDIGKLGEDVSGEGVMYLVTRGERPYCGTQLQASIFLSPKPQIVNGMVHIRLEHDGGGTNFQIPCEISDYSSGRREMTGLTSTAFNSINSKLNSVNANLVFIQALDEKENVSSPHLDFNRIIVRDMYGHSWRYCEENTIMQNLNPMKLKLSKKEC